MTSQGTAHGRFQRAIDAGHVNLLSGGNWGGRGGTWLNAASRARALYDGLAGGASRKS